MPYFDGPPEIYAHALCDSNRSGAG